MSNSRPCLVFFYLDPNLDENLEVANISFDHSWKGVGGDKGFRSSNLYFVDNLDWVEHGYQLEPTHVFVLKVKISLWMGF
jgi:hypothetical protein